ncbi:MAG: SpoIIE family protein phosphatase [Bacteroidota bacterium]|nr:SpoIIE family protein phosphatase [Bacteroidota bacterium]
MKKGIQSSIILLFFSLSVFSQINRYGTPLISRFDAAITPGELRNLCITMDNRGVMYFGNEAGGIVTYDGRNWGMIRTPGMEKALCLITDSRGIVYAGGRNDFGYVQPDDAGRLTYRSLSSLISGSNKPSASLTRPVISAAADSSTVFFSDGRKLYTIGADDDSVKVTDLDNLYGTGNISALLSFDNRLIIADDEEGLLAFSNGELKRLPGGESTAPARFVKLLYYDRDNLLIGDAQKGLLLFNVRTGALNNLVQDRDAGTYRGTGSLTDIVLLPGNQIAAGFSDRGGVYIFSHEGKLIQHISDRTTNVAESSVTAMYCHYTSNSQLWFCTTGFINRAYVSMPATEFSPASGITSVLGPLAEYEGSIYAGTEDGLFTGYTDASGVKRFRRAGNQGIKVNDLINASLSGDEVLIAATDNGLLQVEGQDDFTRFLTGIHFSAVRSSEEEQAVMLSGAEDGTVRTLAYDGYEWNTRHTITGGISGKIRDIEQSAPGEWWMVSSEPSSLTRIHCEPNDTLLTAYGREQGVGSDTVNSLAVIGEKLYLCTGRGVFVYNRQNDSFEKDHDLLGTTFDDSDIRILYVTPEGEIVVSGYDTRNYIALVTATRQGHVVFRRQFDFLSDLTASGTVYFDGAVWIARGRGIVVLDKTRLAFNYGDFSTLFTGISTGSGRILMEGSFFSGADGGVRIPSGKQPDDKAITLLHSDNSIAFSWTTTSYVEEDKTEYRYRLEGFDDDWSAREKRNRKDYTNLPSGDYVFRLKAITITGLEGEELSYAFSVRKPWYTSLTAMITYSAVAAWLIFILIRYFARRLRIRNRRLDSLLRQRNEAAARGRNEIAGLEKYAGTVQQAVLPSAKKLGEFIPNSFLLNRPINTVSGDFFWVAGRGDRTVLAVGDSTGHGVPSALRTVMALCFLDEITDRPGSMTTSEMLHEFRIRLAETFSSLPGNETHHEGIDISLLAIDRSRNTIEYSGAAMQCFRVREMSDQEKLRWDKGEFKPNEGTMVSGKYLLETVYGDRVPLGMHLDGDHAFTQHTWKLEKESSYYLFTDGYPDQFNGATGKKFLKKNLRKLILDIQNYPMSRQKEMLEERLGSWMGKAPQTDDILVAGIRIE